MLKLLVAIALTLLGVACARWAWRARRSVRVGEHPHCRACDRNLFGLPSDTERCPECGADVRDTGAVIPGAPHPNRVRQLAYVLIAIGLLGFAWNQWRAVEWTPLRVQVSPASWLIRDVARGGPVGSTAAEELERRVYADRYEGKQLERVMRALWPVKTTVRPTVRAGDKLPTEVEFTSSMIFRAASFVERPPYYVFRRLDRYQIGDGPWVSSGHEFERERVRAIDRDTAALAIPAAAAPGPTTIRLVYAFRLIHQNLEPLGYDRRGGAYMRDVTADDPATLAWEEQVELPVTLLPADGSDVELMVDPELREAVRGSIGSRDLSIGRNYAGDPSATWGFAAFQPPIGLAFDVFLRGNGGVEIPLGSFSFSKGSRSTGQRDSPASSSKALERFTASKGDLVLRPSKAAARPTLDLVKIWGEEIIIKDVPVVREPPDTATVPP